MNRSIEDGLPGQVFGRLTVRCEAASVVSGHKVERRWVCDCNSGIGYSCLRKRLDGLKWSFEKAITTPTRKLSKRGL